MESFSVLRMRWQHATPDRTLYVALSINILDFYDKITESFGGETSTMADRRIGATECDLDHNDIERKTDHFPVETPFSESLVDSGGPDFDERFPRSWSEPANRGNWAVNLAQIANPIFRRTVRQIDKGFVRLKHNDDIVFTTENVSGR